MTQRHMQQIEDLQAQLQAHTQMMALQQVTHAAATTEPHINPSARTNTQTFFIRALRPVLCRFNLLRCSHLIKSQRFISDIIFFYE